MAAKNKSSKSSAPKSDGSSTEATANQLAATNKAAFFRSLPEGTSYSEAAERAKAAGIVLSKAYFYVLKSESKKRAMTGGGGSRKGTLKTLPSGLMLTSRDPHEKAVLEAVAALGAER